MATSVKVDPMAKKRSEKKEPPTIAVKIDRALGTKAKMIAADRGVDTADYLSESLRSIIDRDWSRLVRQMDGQIPE